MLNDLNNNVISISLDRFLSEQKIAEQNISFLLEMWLPSISALQYGEAKM
jgi:hypothetical protein